MRLYKQFNEITDIDKCILTIGNFDGLHLGHRSIMDRLLDLHKSIKYEVLVITFSNHPYNILFKERKVKLLTSTKNKIQFLDHLGIKHLLLIDFTIKVANMSHKDFLECLIQKFDFFYLVVGNDFQFGKNNLGNVSYLKEKKKNNKFFLEVVPKVFIEKHSISSTLIRNLIEKGDLELVSKMLGRDYFIEGICLKGKQIGQTINFPTINIKNNEMVYPKNGVYKSIIEFQNIEYLAMTFIGDKKNLNKNIFIIETHIFNFNKFIYGKKVKVFFQKRIRDVIYFNSLNALKKQLKIDKQEILSITNKKLK